MVGWVYNPDNSKTDNYVDFRIFETCVETEDGGYMDQIRLDFNVDGNVIDLI